MVRGRPHSEWHQEVKRLRDIGDEDGAVDLLLKIIVATEEESQADGLGVAPADYETLAVICRKRKDHASEVAILGRLARQKHAPRGRARGVARAPREDQEAGERLTGASRGLDQGGAMDG